MTTEPTDQTNATTEAAPSTWMSDATVAGLQEKYVDLINAAKDQDKAIQDIRTDVLAAEVKLQAAKERAASTRKEIEETKILLAIAEGRAPRPNPDAIRADKMNLSFGALRLAGLPDGATRDDHLEHAALMRQVIAAALDIADRADQGAETAPRRRWTPDAVNPDGSTAVTMKRACNGCGNLVGDVTEGELNASVEGRPLPDVRDECSRCSPTAGQPAATNGTAPLTPQTETPAVEPDLPRDVVAGDPLAIPANRFPGIVPAPTRTDLPTPAEDGGEAK
ncbi:hypothetical protein [Actinomadura sp. DC4]|uniref:hypothetical protein n=1 Tax=Actinomadura sp. DC4 TaxID=3055069 RepID=UPI0025AFAEFB|nr:hypothetical protein [Actinomadura sp. DC4]MDN3356034.1 hypothetical protein [Actinomadura sp. DC4]